MLFNTGMQCYIIVVGWVVVTTIATTGGHSGFGRYQANFQRKTNAAKDTSSWHDVGSGRQLLQATKTPVQANAGVKDAQQLPPLDQMRTDPWSCKGWPEPRAYSEGQMWLTEAGDDVNTEARHLHVGACLPWNQTISDKLTLDVRVEVHDVPASYVMRDIKIVVNDDDRKFNKRNTSKGTTHMDGDVLNVLVKETCNATNSYGSTVRRGVTLYSCIMLRRVQVNLAKLLVYTGLQYLRVRATLDLVPVGSNHLMQLWAYTRAPMRFDFPGKPDYPNQHMLQSVRGSGFGSYPLTYVIASVNEPQHPFFSGNKSGVWYPKVVFDIPNWETNVDPLLKQVYPKAEPGIGVSRVFASLDPAFHKVPTPDIGSVILDQKGPYVGTVRVDTTKLSAGMHKLFLRTDVTLSANDRRIKTKTFKFQQTAGPEMMWTWDARKPFPGCTISGVNLMSFWVGPQQQGDKQ